MEFIHDVVIVGSGLAGLRAALEIPVGAKVALLRKYSRRDPIRGLPRGAYRQRLGMRSLTLGNGTCTTL